MRELAFLCPPKRNRIPCLSLRTNTLTVAKGTSIVLVPDASQTVPPCLLHQKNSNKQSLQPNRSSPPTYSLQSNQTSDPPTFENQITTNLKKKPKINPTKTFSPSETIPTTEALQPLKISTSTQPPLTYQKSPQKKSYASTLQQNLPNKTLNAN